MTDHVRQLAATLGLLTPTMADMSEATESGLHDVAPSSKRMQSGEIGK